MTPNCIDVSTWQRGVDWNHVKAAGIRAVVIRAGFGTTKDNMFEEHYSRVGVIGIVKKVCYLALVAVGMVVDYLISSALVSIGISLQINYCFGMIITVWLIINELISILENLGEMGVPLPSFLTSMIKTLKSKVEEQGGKHYQKDKDSEE